MQKSLMTLAIIALIMAYFLRSDVSVVENNTAPNLKINTQSNKQTHVTSPIINGNTTTNPSALSPTKTSQMGHLDRLPEDVKQGIRDKLILHGPMKEVLRADGLSEVRANGRFMHMPVSVQMPDGSIVTKEYSEIPK